MVVALAIVSQAKVSARAQRLPDDLVEVADAQYARLDGLAAGSQESQERQRQAVQQLRLPLEVRTRKTGIMFRLIPAGTFTMGSPEAEQDACLKAGDPPDWVQDQTQHRVTLTRAFYCGKYEVTQGQWEQVMGTNPSRFKHAGRDAPVETVSWNNCQVFATKLCRLEGVPVGTYRLLTEAEWEYACRAGTQTALYNGALDMRGASDANALDPIAWYRGNSLADCEGAYKYNSKSWPEARDAHWQAGTHPVGGKRANGFGLYDTIGNVLEWCRDWHAPYLSGPVTDPVGPASGTLRVLRGGGWLNLALYCRSAARWRVPPGLPNFDFGLRLARTAPSHP
jgi:formylglycine-generating enzyme required for sulfatase activity